MFSIKRRRQSGGTRLAPSPPQTQETPEWTWPVHRLPSSNLLYDPYDVGSPRAFLSVPSVTAADPPRRFAFTELGGSDGFSTSGEQRTNVIGSLTSSPTNPKIKVRVDTLVLLWRRYDQVVELCHHSSTANLILRASGHRRSIGSPSRNRRQYSLSPLIPSFVGTVIRLPLSPGS